MHRLAIEKPLIIAHRGYRARYPENTLRAFAAAATAGAAMIELDVTLSRDLAPVVIHDDTLDRTSSGSGPVADHSLAQLKALDAGSWFDRRFAGEKIPTLAEVLDLKERPVLVNIEIKTGALVPADPALAIERQVVELVRRKKAVGTVLISSFDHRLLSSIAAMADPPALALLTAATANFDALACCRQLGAYSWHPDYRHLDPGQVARMQAAGIRVFPYTVNTVAAIRQVLAMGVDGVITDDPPRALRACSADGPENG